MTLPVWRHKGAWTFSRCLFFVHLLFQFVHLCMPGYKQSFTGFKWNPLCAHSFLISRSLSYRSTWALCFPRNLLPGLKRLAGAHLGMILDQKRIDTPWIRDCHLRDRPVWAWFSKIKAWPTNATLVGLEAVRRVMEQNFRRFRSLHQAGAHNNS